MGSRCLTLKLMTSLSDGMRKAMGSPQAPVNSWSVVQSEPSLLERDKIVAQIRCAMIGHANQSSAVVRVGIGCRLLQHKCGARYEIRPIAATKSDEVFGDTMTTIEPAWYRITEYEEEPFPSN